MNNNLENSRSSAVLLLKGKGRGRGLSAHTRNVNIVIMASIEKSTTQLAPQPIVKIGHYTLGQTLGVGTFGKVKSKRFIAAFASVVRARAQHLNGWQKTLNSIDINGKVTLSCRNDFPEKEQDCFYHSCRLQPFIR